MADSILTLSAVHEWIAHDPFGRPKPDDVSQNAAPITDAEGAVVLTAARNGYVSFRVLVQGAGEYRLSASMRGGLETDLFKSWYHRMAAEDGEPRTWWPDALFHVRGRKPFRLPDPDNAIDGQTTQEFWADVFVPPDAKPGVAGGAVRLTTDGGTTSVPVKVRVLEAVIPDEPCVLMDHNSYSGGIGSVPRGKLTSPKTWTGRVSYLQDCHRLFHEHRGIFHNLSYKQSGVTGPIYAPRIEGRGRDLKLVDWDLFDLYHGPLLDGSAFTTAAANSPPPRRPATPVWGMYTPINPIWPADYLYWGDKGYEVEFVSGVRQFDVHLRKHGWTNTRMEFFFNHKKRHRWFGWDGDEPKYLKDMGHHQEMIRMWEAATGGSPVPWVYRMDASWQMENQLELLAGHRNMWVCSGFHRWYPDELHAAADRGEIVWWYNGTPPIGSSSSSILALVYQTWMRGLHGNCQWSTINAGKDPWFESNGASCAMLYPGGRFGIKAPVPSTRLKVLRNGIQDMDLADRSTQQKGDADAFRSELQTRIPIKIWEEPAPAALRLPPEDWDAYNLNEDHEPEHRDRWQLEPFWWQNIRNRALAQER